MSRVRRALLSVSDKSGLVDFARELRQFEVEIISTGGTAKTLKDAGIPVVDVSDYTGFPEMMDGRVKTLHPKIHGGLLALRNNPSHMEALKKHDIGLIDMVVVNLYPFEQTVSKPGVKFMDAVENIDIGGPTMLRAAAKNFESVAVVVDPGDYNHILEEMRMLKGEVSGKTKLKLARKVFRHTARYDAIIADYLKEVSGEPTGYFSTLTLTYKMNARLRYGENPHQHAAFYEERTDGLSLARAKKIQGKEMSFNNYYDTHSAMMLALEFDRKACAIIKHNNPCGVGIGETPADAYLKALKTDPVSAFGGVIAFNTEVDAEAAREISKLFVEVVIAPSFAASALDIFSSKQNVRVLELGEMLEKPLKGFDVKRIAGGLLVQDWDTAKVDVKSLAAPTKRQPTAQEREALAFAWRVVKHVKSNAIVYAFKDRTAGIGVGQTSRVYAAKTGAINALEPLEGTVCASDGFFPFRDGIDAIKHVGCTAIIQPGGAIKDEEVIQACDEHNIAMLITGARHFKH
ncbi:MAG: bifunctional phosphoribosylaminoimidazolecarboxamide formyltransferase/IMP cyclohydrolase [Nitrospiraceae bacterium]|nr:bifunctional phosphoribosylaminoimidazolecarboxamide formyltransferase/IMP cyclohydrolase [Nitrospiraceae bacterium]